MCQDFFSLLLVSSQHVPLSPTEKIFSCHYTLLTGYPLATNNLFKDQPSIYLSSPFLFFFFICSPPFFLEVPQAPFNYLPLPLGGRWETAFLCKYLRFMNMPSLSTLHRCGRSTDEMLIVARRGPLMHSSPCRNLAGAQTGNRRLGQGRLRQRECKRDPRGRRREKGSEMRSVNKGNKSET